MLVDANLLLYAVDQTSPFHERAEGWLTEQLNGSRPVGFPWPSLVAFLRIVTHPRAVDHPLPAGRAWAQVEEWLACEVAWVPTPSSRHREILGGLIERHQVVGNLVPDAHLVALAIEHGLTVCSADSDFARFDEVRWLNPVAPR